MLTKLRVGGAAKTAAVLVLGLAVALAGCKDSTPAGSSKTADGKADQAPKIDQATKPVADTPAPAPAPKPVADTPAPAPAPKPVADTPAPAPAPKPVADTPAPAPAPKPVADTPAPAPAPKPVADAPAPAPAPKPVADTPAPAPAPKPVADAPAPAPAPKPVADTPAPAPKPVADTPAPAPAPKPVADTPAPAPAPKPVADTPAPAPAPKPVADTPAPVPTPIPAPTGKYQAKFNGRPIKSWAIQLQNPDPDVIARTPYDVVTIDYSRDASEEGAFTREEVARMKKKPDGTERVLIAYMSIGEIEDYRYYWARNGWDKKSKRPSWIGAENPEWLHNYTVKFWNQGWKDIIYAKPGSYLEKIIDAGFDGVYLDKIDITDVLEEQTPKGTTAFGLMVEFVQGIRAAADKKKPGFWMVASNAEAALDDDDYRATMNAIGKEDLFFNSQFNAKTGKLIDGFPNDPDAITEQKRLLQKLIDDDKVVLSVEYIDNKPDLIQPTAKKLAALGYVPYFGPRDLARLSGFTYAQAARIAARSGGPDVSLAASVRKASSCTGSAEAACRADAACSWLPGYDTGAVTVPGYCRIAPMSLAPRLTAEPGKAE